MTDATATQVAATEEKRGQRKVRLGTVIADKMDKTVIGQVENHRQVRELRQEIARTLTVQIEAERRAAAEARAAAQQGNIA